MQQFHGHSLGRVRGGRPGGSIWLYDDQYNTPQVQARLNSGVMILVKVDPPIVAEVESEVLDVPQPIEEIVIEEEQTEEVVEVLEVQDAEETEAEVIDYSSLKTSELRNILKEKGLYDPSRKKKSDMLAILEEHNED